VLPRYKTCGGACWRALQTPAAQCRRASLNAAFILCLHFPALGMNFTATRPQPVVYMTMRADLDCLLAREAQTAGVHLVESCAVKHVNVQTNSVEIISDRDHFR